MDKVFLTSSQCVSAATNLWGYYRHRFGAQPLYIYGVPRGGIPVSYLVAANDRTAVIMDTPEFANLIVDDIVDSGKTKARYNAAFPDAIFDSLTAHLGYPIPKGLWVVFPWEQGAQDTSAEDVVVRLLQYIGENPEREGLRGTPQRFLKAWKEWAEGYNQDPGTVLKCFEDGSENYDEMVIVRNLPFYSHCEHHLAPFFGTATIAYLPDKEVVGLSKLGRILNIYSKRLQVQERLTTQIADALQTHLRPKGVGVLIQARHLCMESRGIATQGHCTITSALRGNFLNEKVRSEFLALAKI